MIVLYAFTTEDRTYQFPPPGLTLHWFDVAFARDDIWAAMRLSLAVAACATLLALHPRHARRVRARATRSFRGKESITLLFVLPIALPGIVTGLALLAGITHARLRAELLDDRRGSRDVLPRDRLQQRRRAAAPAAQQLGRGVDGPRRARPTRPSATCCCRRSRRRCSRAACWRSRCRSTRSSSRCSRPATSSTLPIWFYSELFRPRERPITNVVAVIVILVTLVPILLAYYLTRPDENG